MLTQLNSDVNSRLNVLAGNNKDISLTAIAEKINEMQAQIMNLDTAMNTNVALIDQEMTDHTKLNTYITDLYNNLEK